ncbi:cation:proton antiporter [Serinibacter salmoneus]|uniref:cation:proton antiporter n=1 Tax=Serinibacter salmoneus TaxID=556530 RepID=UPI000BF27BC1|nr:cation:proton antiporter [Serinibacter salmoneus]
MPADVVVSLSLVVLIAVMAPILTSRLRMVPEVVLLLVGGMVIGPHVMGIATDGEAIDLLSELGLGMLFLIAGYEIEVPELTGRRGKRAWVAWLVSLALAIGLVSVLGVMGDSGTAGLSVAIAMTATALGTLLPILHEAGLKNTAVGRSVTVHGAVGELGPVLAMALLIGTRNTLVSLLVLLAFAAVAVVAAVIPLRLQRVSTRLKELIRYKSETTSQLGVRITLLLLILLITVAALMDLDIILGAFAAGFILRRLLPQGDERLEMKLDAIGYGFLIPIFFVISGMSISPASVAADPTLLIGFLVVMIVVRGVPVWVELRLDRRSDLTPNGRLQVATYSATSLPMIVAVMSVAVAAEAVPSDIAGVLVAAGALSVLVMPLMAQAVGAYGRRNGLPDEVPAERG